MGAHDCVRVVETLDLEERLRTTVDVGGTRFSKHQAFAAFFDDVFKHLEDVGLVFADCVFENTHPSDP